MKGKLAVRNIKFAGVFLVVFSTLQLGYLKMSGTWFEDRLIIEGTVRPATWVINQLSSSTRAIAAGRTIVSDQGSLAVLAGCEGTEGMLLLIAAFIAVPGNFFRRSTGMLAGILLLYGFNQLRIVGLFFAHQSAPKLFGLLHGYVAPTLLIVTACLFFLAWLTPNSIVEYAEN